MLYREPKLLKVQRFVSIADPSLVSVLYREPKLLKVVSLIDRLLTHAMKFQCSTVSRNC